MINQKVDTESPIIEGSTDYVPRSSWRSWLIGRPLATADAAHQTIGKMVGLTVFASDALSSTAYGTQEIMAVLAVAGTMAFGYVFPISLGIVLLLTIISISYIQVIHAYPDGGGAYVVAKDNLGDFAGLVAASALLTDYILTVSVSVSSGVAQIVSAYADLYPYRVIIAIVAVMLIMVINLRGVRESGAAIVVPSTGFIIIIALTIFVGIYKYFTGSLGVVENPPVMHELGMLTAITPFLLLHAFSSGTSALTGIEVIANGITAFKEPRSKNAAITLTWMSGLLAFLFLGISFLSSQIGAIPSEIETVISQLGRTVYGGQGFFYYAVILLTTIILFLAVNTAYAGFPRLSALMAQDGFLPRQLTYRGSRLVYSRGIIALAIISSILIVIFQASVTRLIPLYAIGVFLSFTLAQVGMALRWRRSGTLKEEKPAEAENHTHAPTDRIAKLYFDPLWRLKMFVNGFGALCTGIVMMVFAVTKFHDGAYIVLILIPIMVWVFWMIHRHYKKLANKLSLENFGVIPPHTIRHRVIMPVSGVHQGTLAALRYARMLSDDVTAIHVVVEPADAEKVRKKWQTWGDGVRLVMLDSPYRLFVEPLLDYIANISEKRQAGEIITVVVPEFVAMNRVTASLHTNTADFLRSQLKFQSGIVITDVPYHVHEDEDASQEASK
ncbi:MAG: APC family permease [Anaerolineales bacterium]|nr:APC family permease [Anaerolineales bacterium]